MANNELVCPKCRAKMEQGITLDQGHYRWLGQSRWCKGQPPKMRIFLLGGMSAGFDTRKSEVRDITTYRCVSCGYLDSYAK